MSIPKMVGIETEYGAMLFGNDSANPFLAAQLLVEECTRSGLAWVPSLGNRLFTDRSKEVLQTLGDNLDVFLGTGARLYIDHGHPEYSTPECLSPTFMVAADKAGERILAASQHQVNTQILEPSGQQLLVYKNNSDYKNNSYGCHENYLLSKELYEDLVYYKIQKVFCYLLPFLITRTLLCGAGKVGAEHGTVPVGYQISQRADFYEQLIGLQTMSQRPLFNTRDEPHANQQHFRRLHVIIGDANLAEFSTYLKIGTTQLVLHMLEDGSFKHNLTLADPLTAIRDVARDLDFCQPLQLEDGRRLTAVEIQSIYLEQAQAYLARTGGSEDQHAVCREWASVLAQLPDMWEKLATRLDWAIKRRLLEQFLEAWQTSWAEVAAWQPVFAVGTDEAQARSVAVQLGLPWKNYEQQRKVYFGLRRLELQYHDIRFDPTQGEIGLFYRLQQRGAIERILTEQDIEPLCTQPPPDTRSWLRGESITRFSPHIIAANWDQLHFRISEEHGPRHYILNLSDPLAWTEESMVSLWPSTESPTRWLEQIEEQVTKGKE